MAELIRKLSQGRRKPSQQLSKIEENTIMSTEKDAGMSHIFSDNSPFSKWIIGSWSDIFIVLSRI